MLNFGFRIFLNSQPALLFMVMAFMVSKCILNGHSLSELRTSLTEPEQVRTRSGTESELHREVRWLFAMLQRVPESETGAGQATVRRLVQHVSIGRPEAQRSAGTEPGGQDEAHGEPGLWSVEDDDSGPADERADRELA